MPDDDPLPRVSRPGIFPPRALRTAPEERRLVEELTARVLAAHPAWPWPLIEREAHRRAEVILGASRR
jgi:hypothetical protein